jgi:hypothetical protein
MLPAHDARDLGVERGGAAALINEFADFRDAALASVAAAVSSLSAPPRRRQMDIQIPRGVCATLAPGGVTAGAGVAGAERHGRPCAARPVSPVVDPAGVASQGARCTAPTPRLRRRMEIQILPCAGTARGPLVIQELGRTEPSTRLTAAGRRRVQFPAGRSGAGRNVEWQARADGKT